MFDQGLNIDKIREIAGHESEQTSLKNYCFDRNEDYKVEEILENANSNKIIQFNKSVNKCKQKCLQPQLSKMPINKGIASI